MATYHRKDHFHQRAKSEGHRSRAVYKLAEIQKAHRFTRTFSLVRVALDPISSVRAHMAPPDFTLMVGGVVPVIERFWNTRVAAAVERHVLAPTRALGLRAEVVKW